MTMNFDTCIVLDDEDKAMITQYTLEDDIRFFLRDESVYGDNDGAKYNLVDCLLDAYAFYSTEDEYSSFTEEIGGAYVKLRNKAVK